MPAEVFTIGRDPAGELVRKPVHAMTAEELKRAFPYYEREMSRLDLAWSQRPEDAAAELRPLDAVKKLDRLFEEEATRLLEAWDEEVRRLATRYGA
jgi:hypothetical protein